MTFIFKKNHFHIEKLSTNTNASIKRKRTLPGLINSMSETWAIFSDNGFLPTVLPHWPPSRSQGEVVKHIPLPKKGLKKKTRVPELYFYEGQTAEAVICLCTDMLVQRRGKIFSWRISKWVRCVLKTASIMYQLHLAELQGKVKIP